MEVPLYSSIILSHISNIAPYVSAENEYMIKTKTIKT